MADRKAACGGASEGDIDATIKAFSKILPGGRSAETVYKPSEVEQVEMAATLSAAIQDRWEDAQLGPCLGDDIRAGLAAMVFLEALLDGHSPWQFRDVADHPSEDALWHTFLAELPNESKPA